MDQTDTIVAIATAHGKSALAVLRVSGTDAFKIVSACIQEESRFGKASSKNIRLYTFIHPTNKNAIDEITAIKYNCPTSFTGEDMVELICHGGPFVIDAIFKSLQNAGARIAGRGEFTRRAFLAGKIELLKAEAIRAIIESSCDAELQCARKIYSYTNKESREWRDALLEILTIVESRIEFEEEEAIEEIKEEGCGKIRNFLIKIERDLKKREQIKVFENGSRVIIAGPVNAGKSTLFNSLLGYKRSIVHHEPGTTRDLVSERVWINGSEVLLIDSAGIRETTQEIEKEGIALAHEAIAAAELVVWVSAANEELSDWEKEKIPENASRGIVCIINKTDVTAGENKAAYFKKAGIKTICVSLRNEECCEMIVEVISGKLRDLSSRIELPDILLNARHEELGKALKTEMIAAQEAWERPEIAAYHLKKGIALLDELFGKTTVEEVLNRIFDTFCIGK